MKHLLMLVIGDSFLPLVLGGNESLMATG